METISPVNRGVNGNTILYPGTLERGSHDREDTESGGDRFTLSSDSSQCSLSEPEGSCHVECGNAHSGVRR